MLALQWHERLAVAEAYERMYSIPLASVLKDGLGKYHAAALVHMLQPRPVLTKAVHKRNRSAVDLTSLEGDAPVAATAGDASPVGQHTFDAHEIAQKLAKSMKGFGTDEMALVELLAKDYSAVQLCSIKKAYSSLNKKHELVEDIKKETSGIFEDDDFCKALLVLLMDPAPYGDRFINSVRETVEGVGTDEMGLLILLIGITQKDRMKLVANYERVYSQSLADRIKSETSGEFQLLLLGMVESEAKLWARAFHLALFPQWTLGYGTDEDALMYYVALNCGKMKPIRSAYKQLYGVELAVDVAGDTSGPFQHQLVNLINDAWTQE